MYHDPGVRWKVLGGRIKDRLIEESLGVVKVKVGTYESRV